jgi:hypothetical protein
MSPVSMAHPSLSIDRFLDPAMAIGHVGHAREYHGGASEDLIRHFAHKIALAKFEPGTAQNVVGRRGMKE